MKRLPSNFKEIYDSFAPARKEFLYRFYKWTLEDVEREVSANLPLLRRVKGGLAFEFLALAEYMDVEQRRNHLSRLC